MQYLQSNVLLGVGHCQETSMQATGVPPHLVLSYELLQLKKAHEATILELRKEFTDHIASVKEAVLSNPEQTKNLVLENCVIDGVMPLTRSDLVVTMARLQDENNTRMMEQFRSMLPNTLTCDEGNSEVVSIYY